MNQYKTFLDSGKLFYIVPFHAGHLFLLCIQDKKHIVSLTAVYYQESS